MEGIIKLKKKITIIIEYIIYEYLTLSKDNLKEYNVVCLNYHHHPTAIIVYLFEEICFQMAC